MLRRALFIVRAGMAKTLEIQKYPLYQTEILHITHYLRTLVYY